MRALILCVGLFMACGPDDSDSEGDSWCQAGDVECICFPGGGPNACPDEGVSCVEGICVEDE